MILFLTKYLDIELEPEGFPSMAAVRNIVTAFQDVNEMFLASKITLRCPIFSLRSLDVTSKMIPDVCLFVVLSKSKNKNKKKDTEIPHSTVFRLFPCDIRSSDRAGYYT